MHARQLTIHSSVHWNRSNDFGRLSVRLFLKRSTEAVVHRNRIWDRKSHRSAGVQNRVGVFNHPNPNSESENPIDQPAAYLNR
ncbi:hypothetical protein M5D96_000417 [Drosophila gunungcola]|uniref:Uncharacterized protein n=1 Tax=Drosophila gunungcola TaxID=103775 RepID=A0A9P9YWC2_9MUSC|nr:hypothetical protein M5D96_000417 [Drosophila gunungcola]